MNVLKFSSLALAMMLVTGTILPASSMAADQSAAAFQGGVSQASPASPAPAQPADTDSQPVPGGAQTITPSASDSAVKDNSVATIAIAEPVAKEQTVEVPVPVPVFTAEQEARIGEIARDYLLAHTDVLVEVSEKLQVQQHEQQMKALTAAVLQHQDELLKETGSPSYGPADAKVALIEFFDYQCVVCARQAPVIANLIVANPQVRYVFKEWPIFAQRWAPSLVAAETGLQVWQQKGSEAYLAYHNAIYATGHNEGKLTQADITKVAAVSGKLKGKREVTLDVLARTDTLAQNLGLRGTPGIIVMPASGATADNITVIPGGADQLALQAAINRASGNAKQ